MAKKKKKLKMKRTKIPIHGPEGKIEALIQRIEQLERKVKRLENESEHRDMSKGL